MKKAFILLSFLAAFPLAAQKKGKKTPEPTYVFKDSHFHLTNYIQEGISVERLLEIMGDTIGRSTLFGIPLQQQWSYRVDGDDAPKYYLDTDASLYYYSFTDAHIAMSYLRLRPDQRKRLDPMITGFNPTDMYAAEHIKRVLTTFPGVFVGIGEFTIHKEFVSSKIDGDVASLYDPALDRIFSFCAETGLLAILHSDINKPFPKDYTNSYLQEVKEVFGKHKDATIIWAHIGLGRVVRPVDNQVYLIEAMLADPSFDHIYFDISWDEVAKYITASPEAIQAVTALLEKYPTRFLFGTDNVAPADARSHYAVYKMYQPLWEALTPETRDLILKGNYNRLFDAAQAKVRAWESAQGMSLQPSEQKGKKK